MDTRPLDRKQEGLKPKDLVGVPWLVAFALRTDGWYLRQEIIWAKTAAMPESVTDRCTRSHETIFMLTKQDRYYYDAQAIAEPCVSNHSSGNGFKRDVRLTYSGDDGPRGSEEKWNDIGGTRNRRDVWAIGPEPTKEEHYAAFPSMIPKLCIMAGTSERGCCPKCGSPWKRMMERTGQEDPSHGGSRFDTGKTGKRDGGERTQAGKRYLRRETGWKPSCSCNAAELVSCTVLDPFAGTGTTGRVAEDLGRNSIMVELSERYIGIIRRRTEQVGMLTKKTAEE
jgi:hypothetical protein